MKKLFALFTLCILGSQTLAQVDTQAETLLTCAQNTLGGAALEFESVHDTGTATFFGPGGQAAAEFETETFVDFAQERFRSTFFQGDLPAVIQQVTPEGGFTSTPQSGAVDLPSSQRDELRRSFVTGPYGLHLGAARDEAVYAGEATLKGVSGERVDLVTDGVASSLLLDEDCRLLAEVTQSSQLGEVVTLYSDYREVDGLVLPFSAELYAGGALVARVQSEEVNANVPLEDAVFAHPE